MEPRNLVRKLVK